MVTPLLLTAAYGHDAWFGVWISLRSDSFDPHWLRECLLAFGCAEERHAKIIECLTHSGRYDCMVQAAWINRRFGETYHSFMSAGVQIVIDPDYRPPLMP
ncbi:hypothetical protein EVB53_083 [Rhizobium phage RHph_Y60]|nr:hypothetical protein EVB53_083 [Rhizobium phage RHph_Y60]